MKKILLSFVAIMLLTISARADEGMWLLPLLQKMNIKVMQKMGCKLSAQQIYSVNHSSLKDAIVQFGGGCTGEMISYEGLLVTNHHCGYSSIQKLSSDEHNYLENGYWAMNRSEELPVKGLTVKFLQKMTDITSKINAKRQELQKQYKDSTNSETLINKGIADFENELKKESDKENPYCESIIENYYNNNVQYLIVYKTYKDVRFVGAPPASIGKFGGETDNWMWPRHTGDFSMFRVYANKDNEPADYSPDNVPYQPKKALTISLKGVKKGDFTFIMGYPGSTQRFQTAAQLSNMLKYNAIRVKARTMILGTMDKYMSADSSIRLKYANTYAGMANGWKKWQGEELAMKKLNILSQEEKKESDLLKWIDESNNRKALYGNPITPINQDCKKILPLYSTLVIYNECLSPIVRNAISFVRAYKNALKEDSKDTTKAIQTAYNEVKVKYKDYYEPMEKVLFSKCLNFMRDNLNPKYYPKIDSNFNIMNIDAYTDTLFKYSAFANAKSFEKVKNMTNKQIHGDLLFKYYDSIIKVIYPLYDTVPAIMDNIDKNSKDYAAALLEWKKGEPSYPDANFTMRLTYGTVKGYSPRDGVQYKYYTTLKGVMEKYNPNSYEFNVPKKLIKLYDTKDYGQFAAKPGQLDICFLTNNDITGGNSGSPVMNAHGNLIGLAFDGNWESMSSDVMFEPNLQRCICVDIRYVLFLMDKFGGAGYLLREMNFEK